MGGLAKEENRVFEMKQAFEQEELPYRIFYEASGDYIRTLAFETKIPPKKTITLPTPDSPYPEAVHGGFAYSWASLEGVVKVTPYQRRMSGRAVVLGLMLEYQNGDKACVGQMRLDCLGEPLTLAEGDALHIGIANSEEAGLPGRYVCMVAKEKQTNSTFEWVDCGVAGKLEWWFSWHECYIYYHAQSQTTEA
jgi:hypothetical protein